MVSGHFILGVLQDDHLPKTTTFEWFEKWTSYTGLTVASKMLIFQVFLHLKGPLVATFNEECAITFRKYLAEQSINIPKVSQKHKLLRSQFSVFALE